MDTFEEVEPAGESDSSVAQHVTHSSPSPTAEVYNPDPHPESGQGKWRETAADMARTGDFYRGLLEKIDVIVGEKGRVRDDGTISDSMLALKLPEVVEEMKKEIESLKKALQSMHAISSAALIS